MAPFGASCVLAFGVWNAPLSQPRNIIGGHLISTFIGLSIYHLFGNEYWTIALAVGMAIAVMMLTRTTHPPAGADPIIVILFEFRMPRMVIAILVGSALAMSGAILQGLSRNPLADPGIIGINAGAGLTVVIFVYFSEEEV
ncbi:iron chelate uptake ABC transporter family permease subunit, partial [Bacillus sp. SS-TM]